MYYKVEPSGCCERKGMVQIRFSFYLEPGDYGYDKHHVEVPIIPKDGYPGKVDEVGSPYDMEDYIMWIDKLPTEWVNNPFHNHFCLLDPDVSDVYIHTKGKDFLRAAKADWDRDTQPNVINAKVIISKVIDSERLSACATKIDSLKNNMLQGAI